MPKCKQRARFPAIGPKGCHVKGSARHEKVVKQKQPKDGTKKAKRKGRDPRISGKLSQEF